MTLELRAATLRVGEALHIHETNLTLQDDSFNVLLGPTLAGKTTLMQLMSGLVRPTGGTIHFQGRDVTNVPVQRRNVAMVYQQFINYPNFTVYENIASPLRVAHMDTAEIDRRVRETADLLRLGPFLNRRPAELSGGQQQRTAIARALAKDSDLILLDEPLANLDYKLREELRDELPRLFERRRCIVVYATTEPSEALLFGGNTATLFEGRITQFGATARIYRSPGDIVTARVMSDPPINTAEAVKRGATLELGHGVVWPVGAGARGLADGAYTIGLRPHNVSPVRLSETAPAVQARVLVADLSGSESIVHFALAGTTWVSLSHGIHRFEVGATATLYADIDRLLYFGSDGRLVAGGT